MTSITGSGASTLALKPMGGVNQSPKQRVHVTTRNGDIVAAIFLNQLKCALIYCGGGESISDLCTHGILKCFDFLLISNSKLGLGS